MYANTLCDMHYEEQLAVKIASVNWPLLILKWCTGVIAVVLS